MSCVERALCILRDGLLVPYTEQYREEKLDGRRRCTGPAKRKLAVSFFKKIGLHGTLKTRHEYLREKRQQLEDAQFKAGLGTDLAMTSLLRKTETTVKPPVPAQHAPSPTGPEGFKWSSTNAGAFSEALLDEIHQEHPDWAFSRIYAEAARRANAPPLGSSGEPSAEG